MYRPQLCTLRVPFICANRLEMIVHYDLNLATRFRYLTCFAISFILNQTRNCKKPLSDL